MNPTRLFVGNLSNQTGENDLQDYFAQAGAVTSVNLMLDKITGKSRGCAFVEFADAEAAQRAIDQFHNQEFHGRPLTINVARPREDRPPHWGDNRVEPLATGDGWREERTGLHELEFIETRRHWFTGTTPHHTHGGVNVLNLVQGTEAVVESPSGAFEPFVVHYVETFIVPAEVGAYTIRPHGAAEGTECATMKAFVRQDE